MRDDFEAEAQLTELRRTHGDTLERRDNIRHFAALYAESFTTTPESRRTLWSKIAHECLDPDNGQQRLRFYASALHERVNEFLRVYTERVFIYEYVGVTAEIKHDAEHERFKAFQLRQELIPLCKTLNIALDRGRDMMPPVNHTSYIFS